MSVPAYAAPLSGDEIREQIIGKRLKRIKSKQYWLIRGGFVLTIKIENQTLISNV